MNIILKWTRKTETDFFRQGILHKVFSNQNLRLHCDCDYVSYPVLFFFSYTILCDKKVGHHVVKVTRQAYQGFRNRCYDAEHSSLSFVSGLWWNDQQRIQQICFCSITFPADERDRSIRAILDSVPALCYLPANQNTNCRNKSRFDPQVTVFLRMKDSNCLSHFNKWRKKQNHIWKKIYNHQKLGPWTVASETMKKLDFFWSFLPIFFVGHIQRATSKKRVFKHRKVFEQTWFSSKFE